MQKHNLITRPKTQRQKEIGSMWFGCKKNEVGKKQRKPKRFFYRQEADGRASPLLF